jgi:hypothetical protein
MDILPDIRRRVCGSRTSAFIVVPLLEKDWQSNQ